MDVARALVETNRVAPLKFMPNEDATFGFWVMGMNLRRVDHPRAKTPAGHCCYGCAKALDPGPPHPTARMAPTDSTLPVCPNPSTRLSTQYL